MSFYRLYRLPIFLLFSATCFAVHGAALPDFSEHFQRFKSCVVNISTTHSELIASEESNPRGFQKDNPYLRFLERFREDPEDISQKNYSLGSGFIISPDGYILTNNHVIEGASAIRVRLSDRREFDAVLIGADSKSDIALIKIDAQDLPVAPLGTATDLKVGQWVLAIGSPFGFEYSATAGIVSGIGRMLPDENYIPYIQTDVAINPGNSGGPLFNQQGEIIGINAQIFTRNGVYSGVSFAIPVDLALDVARQLKIQGHVTRGWLGVRLQNVTGELAESFRMGRPYGALVSQVVDSSPAHQADIRVGDIIVEFNGNEVQDALSFPPMVAKTPVQSDVPVTVVRGGKRVILNVVIEDLGGAGSPVADSDTDQSIESILDIEVIEVPARIKEETGFFTEGVYVDTVNQGQVFDAGLRPGDIIVSLNNQPVSDLSLYRKALATLPRNSFFPALIIRDTSPMFIAIKIKP